MVKFKYAGKKLFIMSVVSIKYVAYCMLNIWLEMDQRELESELQNMMKLHAEGVKQVKKMERIVRESDQRAKDAKVDSGRIMELMETLESKLKKEKSCSDEVHEHLQIHMSKARKLQLQLDDAEERAEMAEANYLKMKDVLVAEKEKRN